MSSDDPRVGAIFLDRLKVIRHIGGGGMGAVYEVEHLRTGHLRALKIVRPEYSAQPRYMQRLLREARVAATLNTPHVAETLDAGVLEDGSAYVLMELLHGRPLISLLEERPRLEPEEVVWIASEICLGLEVAHAADIVHRDLKPENIFLVPSGDDGALVKILDFGISQFPASLAEAPNRLTREGTILGTPFYMSPEQAAGRTMDARTDLYALGVVMYEALSGSLPFDSPTIGELFLRIAAGEYMPLEQRVPELDPNLVAVVARAMDRDPAKRYDSAVALREALVPFLGVGPAAPGRVTLRLNALAQPPKPRVETLDYSSSPPSERETMAPPESEPPPGELALTPAHASPIVSSKASSPRPVRRSSESMETLDGSMAVASTPPAGMPTFHTPASIPPPSSIPQALTPAAPSESAPAPVPVWRQPLLLAVAAAVVAFALSLWWGAARTPQASAPDPRPAPT
ncbi:MAG: protein kinase, partial [Deltaproteobacteria bacterium]|nr:protein kinase [Deltaproteobacteria bacterium]